MAIRLLLAALLATVALPVSAQGWKPLQEFTWLVGKWSGSAEAQAGRVGGRSTSFSVEAAGNVLYMRSSTIYPAMDGAPEETNQELCFIAYDGDKRRYIATIYFSTGVWGVFDVENTADTTKMTSTQLYNYEAGAKFRMTLSKKPEGELHVSFDVGPAGKEFSPISLSKLKK